MDMQDSSPSPPPRVKRRERWLARYGSALLAVGAAVLLRAAVTVWVGPGLPTYITFYPAVMLVALLAGFGPGLLTTAVSGLVTDYYLLPPTGTFAIERPVDAVGLVMFLWMGMFMCFVAEVLRRARLKAVAYDREQVLRETRRQKEFLADVLERSSQAFGVGYPDGRLGLTNRAFEELTGYTAEELERSDWAAMLTPPEWRELERQKLAELVRTGLPVRYEKEYFRKDGRRVPIELLVHLARGEDGKPDYFYSFLTDITNRKQREAQLQRLNRTLNALNKSSQIMMRAASEADYLQEVCKVVISDCGHAMVWIGFAEEDADRTVRQAAHAGLEAGYLETLKISWEENEQGNGPTGAAIRSGKPCVCKNIATDPALAPWRAEALRHGLASSLALPLLSDGKAFGAITLYLREVNSFPEEEIKLLAQLADDVAYCVRSLRAISRRKAAEEQLSLLSTAVESAANGVAITDREGRILWINPAFTRLTGYTSEEAIGRDQRLLKSGAHPSEFYRQLWVTLLQGEPWQGELVNRRKDGSLYTEEMTITPVRAGGGDITHFVAIRQDVTARRRAEQRTDLLADTASRLLKTDSPARIVEDLCEKVMAFLGCETFFNFLKDDQSGTALSERLRRDRRGGGPQNRMARLGRPDLRLRRPRWQPRGGQQCAGESRATNRMDKVLQHPVLCLPPPNGPGPDAGHAFLWGARADAIHRG